MWDEGAKAETPVLALRKDAMRAIAENFMVNN